MDFKMMFNKSGVELRRVKNASHPSHTSIYKDYFANVSSWLSANCKVNL